MEKEALFATVIESIYERHSATLITMAKGKQTYCYFYLTVFNFDLLHVLSPV